MIQIQSKMQKYIRKHKISNNLEYRPGKFGTTQKCANIKKRWNPPHPELYASK